MTVLARDTALATGALALGALLWSPQLALGVLGGGALVGLSMWAITGVVNGLTTRAATGETGAWPRAVALVKFFTRHAILAATGYVMMVRLHLDPVGMFVGVTSVVVAAGFAAVRRR